MTNRTALDPKFKPVKRCEVCGRIIDDVHLTRTGRWRAVPGYDSKRTCSPKCSRESLKPGNPAWLRRYYPDYEPPC